MQIAEHFQRVSTRRFGNEPGDLPAVAHEDYFFLIALQGIEYCAEVPGDLGDRQSFHGEQALSDAI